MKFTRYLTLSLMAMYALCYTSCTMANSFYIVIKGEEEKTVKITNTNPHRYNNIVIADAQTTMFALNCNDGFYMQDDFSEPAKLTNMSEDDRAEFDLAFWNLCGDALWSMPYQAMIQGLNGKPLSQISRDDVITILVDVQTTMMTEHLIPFYEKRGFTFENTDTVIKKYNAIAIAAFKKELGYLP